MTQSNLTRTYHSVFLNSNILRGAQLEQAFLAVAKKLDTIPGVEKFECLKQISKKNKFEFGLSMEFANQQLYDTYNNHPDQVAFIQNHWLNEVEDF